MHSNVKIGFVLRQASYFARGYAGQAGCKFVESITLFILHGFSDGGSLTKGALLNNCSIKLLIWSSLFLSAIADKNDSAITYELNGGRFGDSIQTYCKAQYLKFVHKFDHFFYVPFEHSQYLQLDSADEKYTPLIAAQYSEKIRINKESDMQLFSQGALHVCHFYTQVPNLYEFSKKNPAFKQLLQEKISPLIPIQYLDLPKDRISIAVHVRKGGGFDKPLITEQLYSGHENMVTYHFQSFDEMKAVQFSDVQWPSKFPPDQYYIDQIRKISQLLEHQPLYVYIFTDDSDPEGLTNKYEKLVNLPHIQFDCYKKDAKDYKKHVLDDFFNIAQFDCLIRSSSLFAQAAQLIGNHKIIIFPKHTIVVDNKIIVDKVGVIESRI